tara:strand:- start:40 stop:468 length:429 start_codon:yes stop_codon:yes gene_type:complete
MSNIVATKGQAQSIRGTDKSEREAATVLADAVVGVDRTEIPDFLEYESGKLYARQGAQGSDMLWHIHMETYPPNFRHLLAEAFMEVLDTIDRIEAKFMDTSDFEERPHFYYVTAKGWAVNPMARAALEEKLIPALEAKLVDH